MRSFYKDLLKMLKKNEYSTDQNIIENHCIDWRGKYKGSSDIIFFPNGHKCFCKPLADEMMLIF